MYKASHIFADCSRCQMFNVIRKTDITRRALNQPLVFFIRKCIDGKVTKEAVREDDECAKIDLTPSKSATHRVTSPCYSYSKSLTDDNKPFLKKRNSNTAQRKKKVQRRLTTENKDSISEWVMQYRTNPNNSNGDIVRQQELEVDVKCISRYPWKTFEQTPSLQKKRSESELNVQGEVLFGQFPVLLALQTRRRKIYNLFMKAGKELVTEGHYADILSIAKQNDIQVTFCERSVLSQLSGDRPHQGVCLDVKRMKPQPFKAEDNPFFMEELSDRRKPCVWLYLDAVQDPMNLGAILRTSCFMNVEKVFMSENESCPLSPVVSKASAGALEIMDILSLSDKVQFFKLLRENGWSIVGTVGRSNLSTNNKVVELEKLSSLSERTIVVLGNEGTGLPEDILDLCTTLVSITPGNLDVLHKNLDSLNVSVATGIILHHVISLNSVRKVTKCDQDSSFS